MTSLTDEALQRSLDLLTRAVTPHGFVASPEFDHYAQIWARDAAISSLGALVSGDDDLIGCAIRTMGSLAKTVSPLGHVAAVFHTDGKTWDWADGGVVDTTPWYVILVGAVLASTGEVTPAEVHWPKISRAMSWLSHQDVTGTGLISTAPSTDWMDSSLVRSGRTLNLNALYHWAALAARRVANTVGAEQPCDPEDLAWRINTLFWPTAGSGPELLLKYQPETPARFPHPAMVEAHAAAAALRREHYVSHVIHAHHAEHCDVLAHTILISTGVADQARSRVILGHLADSQVDLPHPSRVWIEPIDPSKPSSMFVPGVETHLNPRWRNPPHGYHNGGAWPFVGGFHVTSLALSGQIEEAEAMLERLAAANQAGEWGFHEWLHGRTGEPMGAPGQTWNAGMFVLAAEAVKDPDRVRMLFS